MSRQAYPYSTATAARHITNHGTSSAFSSSANPDEDWTKISDLAERRRIQNRIAQRNYRKKLKRRLEDLERRAGSSSVSPPQSHAVLDTQRPNDSKPQQYKRSPETTQRQVEPRHMPNQYTPPMTSEEEFPMFPSHGYEREGSRTPPFTYHTYPAPEDINYAPYPSQAYHSDRSVSYGEYIPAVTLPSMMHFNDALKRETQDTMSPYHMSYSGAVPIIDIQQSYGYDDPTTPPLSTSWDHSGSESGYHYPTTPLSMPASPQMVQI